MDLNSYEVWESLNERIAEEIQASDDVFVRCYRGLGQAVFELAQGTAQFYSHKRSIALVNRGTPHFNSFLPYFYKEGYQVQLAPETGSLKEWAETLNKDTCLVLMAEDHAMTGEIYETSELEAVLNQKKIYCLKVSHHNHLYRPQVIQPYSVRICSYDPVTVVAQIGIRLRAPAVMAASMDWDAEKFSQAVSQARQGRENQELIEKFEKNLPQGFQALLQTSSRNFDRALIYTEMAAGEALQQFLATALNLQLKKPGWENRLETSHLCRWGGTKNYDEWWNPRPAESILRGLLILSTEVLEHPELRVSLEKSLRECQIAELS